MSDKIVNLRIRHLIAEEAADWMIKLDRDEPPSIEERATLKQWLEQSPLHEEELGKIVKLWGKMNVLTDLAVPLGKTEVHQGRSLFEYLCAALSDYAHYGRLAFVFGGFALVITLVIAKQADPLTSSNGMYATIVGQQEATVLADGSTVLLNTNSQIKVEYGAHYRDIHLLRGEVFFTVESKPDHPFRVYVGNGRVEAIGTAFSVYLKDDSVDVTVSEGRVALAAFINTEEKTLGARNEVSDTHGIAEARTRSEAEYVELVGSLEAGQSATISGALALNSRMKDVIETVQTLKAYELAGRNSWQKGLLTFTGDPLEQVVSEISRYTTVNIDISDPEVKNIRIGGRFPIGETKAMLDALEANFGLKVTHIEPGHVLLSVAEK